MQNKGYIPELDGLRAIAIIFVLFAHGVDDVPQLLKPIAFMGWCGVDLFFVLSGFLITGGLLKTKAASNYFTSFYGKRFLRIFPVFYLALTVTFCVLPHFLSSPPLPPRHDYPYYWLYLNNWVYFLHLPNTQYVGHFWSLAVEEQFYLVWPAIVLFLSRRHLYVLATVGLIGAPILRAVLLLSHLQLETVYRNTFCRVDPLMAGVLSVLLLSEPKVQILLGRQGKALALVALGIWLPCIVILGEGYGTRRMLVLGLSINAIVFGMVLLVCVTHSIPWLAFTPLRLIGMWSYGIYVYHLAFVHFAHMIPWLTPGAGRFLVENFCAIAIAAISYYGFEKPLLRYKDRFAPSWKNVKAPRELTVKG